MNRPNGQTGNASTSAKHGRQNTRVVPVIPRQLARKPKEQSTGPVRSPVKDAEPGTATTSSDPAAAAQADSIIGTTHGSSPSPVATPHEPRTAINASSKAGPEQEAVAGAEPGEDKTDTSWLGGREPSKETDADVGTERSTSSQQTPATIPFTEEDRPASDLSENRKSAPVPVELPPPFYPTAHSTSFGSLQSPTAAGEDSQQRRSFIFGGNVDSSAPSPVPPASAGSWNSSVGPAGDRAFSPDPKVNGFGKPTPIFGNSADPLPDQDPSFSRAPPPSAFVTPPTQPMLNGHTPHPSRNIPRERYAQSPRSGSLASNPSETPYVPPYPSYPYAPALPFSPNGPPNDSAVSLQRPTPYPQFPPAFAPHRSSSYIDPRFYPSADQDQQSLHTLRNHVLDLCGKRDFSDCSLRLMPPTGESAVMPGHAFILSRSPRLRTELLPVQAADSQKGAVPNHRVIDVPGDAFFRNGNMFHLAYRYLYGGSLIRREHLPGNLKSPKQVMEWVLSYVAAGWYLQVPEVATAGLALASELMIVDNLDIALEFALTPQDTPRYNGSLPEQDSNSINAPSLKYSPFAPDFLQAIMRYMIWPLTSTFEFDASAPELENLKLIPEQLKSSSGPFAHASRPSVSNPKLQGIQLGDFQNHNTVNRTLSSVLLSIPSLLLQSLFAERSMFERLTPQTRRSMMIAVVHERERRRIDARKVYEKLSQSEQQQGHLAGAKHAVFMTEEVIVSSEGEPRLGFRPVGEGT